MSGKPGSLFKYGFSNPKAGAPLASSVAGPSSATQAEVSAEQSASLQVSSSPKRPAEQSQRPEATISLDQLPASREGEASSGEALSIFSESDEECQEVQDIQQEIPSTLYPLSNAEDAGPEVGDDFASELGY